MMKKLCRYSFIVFILIWKLWGIAKNIDAYSLKPMGSNVTEEAFYDDIERIIIQEKITGIIDIYDAEKTLDSSLFPSNLIKQDEKSIYLLMGVQCFKAPKSYNEVRTVMKLWRYIETRNVPFEIYGIYGSFLARPAMIGTSKIILSYAEYKKLFANNITDNMSEKEIIEKLTDVFVKDYAYRRISP